MSKLSRLLLKIMETLIALEVGMQQKRCVLLFLTIEAFITFNAFRALAYLIGLGGQMRHSNLLLLTALLIDAKVLVVMLAIPFHCFKIVI